MSGSLKTEALIAKISTGMRLLSTSAGRGRLVAHCLDHGFNDVPSNDESALKAVSQQPVSVAIEADQRSFELYGGGVYHANCNTQLDHGVLVVGYGTDHNSSSVIIPGATRNIGKLKTRVASSGEKEATS